MKKVAILTLPLNENYGGMLQAAALYGFLNEQKFEVVFLNNDYFKSKWKWLMSDVLERLPFQNIKGKRAAYLKKSLHKGFVDEYISHRTRPLRSEHDFRKVLEKEKFDAVIVGSDQVWRWDYILDGFERYFLSFANGAHTRKIAYAASFGKSHWQAPEKEKDLVTLLADFYAVSTRETDAIKICEGLEVDNCQQVLDPTMLVGRDFYKKFLTSPSNQFGDKTLLTYVLDETAEKTAFIHNIQCNLETAYQLASLGLKSGLTAPEWVSAFHNADYVVTDSFHGMVFSILFNKQFIVIGNSDRGVSRFTSLLDQLNISSRLVNESNLSVETSQNLIDQKIDYTSVNSRLQILRMRSIEFLLKALEE